MFQVSQKLMVAQGILAPNLTFYDVLRVLKVVLELLILVK